MLSAEENKNNKPNVHIHVKKIFFRNMLNDFFIPLCHFTLCEKRKCKIKNINNFLNFEKKVTERKT